jgi:hypothetical protein
MAITSYLDEFDIDPETKRVLDLALEMTRTVLGLADDFANGIIAKRIIELARAGEWQGALKTLRGHLFRGEVRFSFPQRERGHFCGLARRGTAGQLVALRAARSSPPQWPAGFRRLDRISMCSVEFAASLTGRPFGPSGRLRFELMNGAIGGAQPPAELAADRGHELDCGGRGIFGECSVLRPAHAIAGQFVVGDHRSGTRSLIENRQLAKHGARRKCRQPNIGAVRELQISARGAFGDDQDLVALITFTKHDRARVVNLTGHECGDGVDSARLATRKKGDMRQGNLG